MHTDKTLGQTVFNLLAAVRGLEGFDLKEMTDDLAAKLKETREFVVVGEGYYGRGVNEHAALRAYKDAGGSLKKYIVYSCPIGCWVDGWGSMVWPNAATLMGYDKPFEFSRKGFKTVKKAPAKATVAMRVHAKVRGYTRICTVAVPTPANMAALEEAVAKHYQCSRSEVHIINSTKA